jgi:membrane associated rhomboid family serine protease
VEEDEPSGMVTLRRCSTHRQAEDYALVLIAMGIGSQINRQGDFTTIFVTRQDAIKANRELAAYDRENEPRKLKPVPQFEIAPRFEAAVVYSGLMFFFFAAIHGHFFLIDWLQRGALQAGLLLDGEWWRAFTALYLHASVVHLLGNLVFGAIFLILLGQVAGIGMAALSMVLAGAAGNYVAALLHTADHTSIGASTAIFAGLGVLTALQQIWRQEQMLFSIRHWIPLAGGITLLAFLGFSGDNTDITAHITGFGCGIVAGVLLALWRYNWMVDHRLQRDCAFIAIAISLAAWAAAL